MRTKHLILFLAVIAILALASCHSEKYNSEAASSSKVVNVDTIPSTDRKAGTTETSEQVNASEIDKCFVVTKVSDSLWSKMQTGSVVKRDDLRHIKVLHWDLDKKTHIGELICNRIIADTLVQIFKELYNAKYPIQRMVLPHLFGNDDEAQMQANNTSCYCPRTVKGTKVMSKHARGLAVDLNPLYNPYYKSRKDGSTEVQPSTATPYVNRSKEFSYKIDDNDLAYELFTSHGFRWGGDWKSCKDYQHFEWKGIQ